MYVEKEKDREEGRMGECIGIKEDDSMFVY